MKTRTDTTLPVAESGTDVSLKRRILLVDDHPVTRAGVAVLIDQESDLCVCGEAESAPKALEIIQKTVPDLVVLDILLKTSSGIELMKNIKALLPDLPVLIMSMHDESLYAQRALRAGARGYIMKQEASEKILTAIRCVLSGDFYLSEKMKVKLLHSLVQKKHSDEVSFPIDNLSDREMEVFQLIGNGFTTRQIAGRLNLSIKTIDSYREHLKLKLGIEKGSELVRHAIQWTRGEDIVQN